MSAGLSAADSGPDDPLRLTTDHRSPQASGAVRTSAGTEWGSPGRGAHRHSCHRANSRTDRLASVRKPRTSRCRGVQILRRAPRAVKHSCCGNGRKGPAPCSPRPVPPRSVEHRSRLAVPADGSFPRPHGEQYQVPALFGGEPSRSLLRLSAETEYDLFFSLTEPMSSSTIWELNGIKFEVWRTGDGRV